MRFATSSLFLGGSFNPPHNGHMRLAIECAEVFCAARLYFIPCALPPHKSAASLLPFDLRCALLRAAIDSMEGAEPRERLAVCELENERAGPSYTVDTLRLLAKRQKDGRPLFVLGGEDYARLDSWRDWQSLPEHADLLVLPRPPSGPGDFQDHSARLWPGARPADAEERRSLGLPSRISQVCLLPGGGKMLFMPQPMLDISSSLVRERWLAGRDLNFLLPGAVRRLLAENAELLNKTWRAVFKSGS
ncbi:nicotinate (nicotinamide) nucleotide adenylyltransferase [Desulfovibrio sp. OttesenSCG-928-G11]|nr:nicotinate (nicotinamide) nucleotide adenylyltransferase [Desulfovibrio sp. OttesenSCG-928-G11]